jgi:hypothetical protein
MHLRREMRRFEVVDLWSRRGDRNRYLQAIRCLHSLQGDGPN